MIIPVEKAAQILSYLPYTEIAGFKRVNKTFGCAVERYRNVLPKPIISVAMTSRGETLTEKHARIVILHKKKSFCYGLDPCCKNFETAFPIDGFVYNTKGVTRRRIASIAEFIKVLLSKATIDLLDIQHLSPEWMFMYKFILNMAVAGRSEISTVKIQFNPNRDKLSLEWFKTTMYMNSGETPPKLLKLSTEEHNELFEIEELVHILNSLGDHYPEVQFVLNREWIYAVFFRTLSLWLTVESVDTFKFSWCFEKSDTDATANAARYYAQAGQYEHLFGRGGAWNPALNWMFRIEELEESLVEIPPQVFQDDSYVGHAGLHTNNEPPFIQFQRPNGEDAHRRGGDILKFNIRKVSERNLVFITMETI